MFHRKKCLEGQVAALSAGAFLDGKVFACWMRSGSSLYRPDQNSYTLYPNKNLPGFLEKNNIPLALPKDPKPVVITVPGWKYIGSGKKITQGNGISMAISEHRRSESGIENLAPDYYLPAAGRRNRLLELFEDIHHRQFTAVRVPFFEGTWALFTGTWYPNCCWPSRNQPTLPWARKRRQV